MTHGSITLTTVLLNTFSSPLLEAQQCTVLSQAQQKAHYRPQFKDPSMDTGPQMV